MISDSLLIGFYKKLRNVSCEYARWVFETQLCKLRDVYTLVCSDKSFQRLPTIGIAQTIFFRRLSVGIV